MQSEKFCYKSCFTSNLTQDIHLVTKILIGQTCLQINTHLLWKRLAIYDNSSTYKMVAAKDYDAPYIAFGIVLYKVFCLTSASGHAGRGDTA